MLSNRKNSKSDMTMKYIAIIPARGGSKGIKNKNLQMVGKYSLVALAILQAKKIDDIQRIIVSTDCPNIIRESKDYGAEVHHRSKGNATDYAKTIDVIKEICVELNLIDDICILLQPTSPLRQQEDLTGAIAQFKNKKNNGSLISVSEPSHHPYKMFINEEDRFLPVNKLSDLESPRQKLPKAFMVNGAIYIAKFIELIKHETFFVQPCLFYQMESKNSLDIDTFEDLLLANIIKEL